MCPEDYDPAVCCTNQFMLAIYVATLHNVSQLANASD